MFLPPIGTAIAAERVALLVGVADYAVDHMDLANPVNDVDALEPILESLGFETTVIRDEGIETTAATLEGFAKKLKAAEVGLFFFAGHGIQINGENYLLARDVGQTAETLLDGSVKMSRIRQLFAQNRPKHSVIIIDACRDMPFTVESSERDGLAPTPQAYPGFLIAYATAPGTVAFDGEGNNSNFTSALIEHLATPGLDLRLVFGRIRQDVVLTSRGSQVPWVEESLLESLQLKEGSGLESQQNRDEIDAWRRLAGSGQLAGLKEYLDAYPDGLFAQIATQQVERLESIERARASNSGVLAETVAQSDREQLAAALEILGFLPELETTAHDDETLLRALDGYALAASVSSDKIRLEQINAEAARTALTLGAVMSGRIKSDMAALASIKQTKVVAEEAVAEIKRLYGGTADGKQVLQEAAVQVEAIDAAHDRVLARMDQSRSFYERQLERTSRHLRPFMTEELVGSVTRTAFQQQTAQTKLLSDDFERFVRHLDVVSDPEKRGSIAWLKDFLPE
ncbi:MAG: caspase domain-containing protein [Paracoccaceae bacterium]